MAVSATAGTTDHWSGRLVFIMATVGFSVGLGNIWRFPYVAGENGGGAFVLVYMVAVALIGLPLVIGEMLLGRRGQRSPVATMAWLAQEAGASPVWRFVGLMTMITAFLITGFYAVIGGWTLDYSLKAVTGALTGVDAETSAALFGDLLGSAPRLILWQAVFLGLTIFVVARGLKGGIETAVNIMMPTLFLLLVGLAAFALVAGDANAGLSFLFSPDFSKIGPDAVLAAVGQAFFSVGVAMAAMMTYGAYLQKDENIPSSATIVAGADTGVALLAGVAIFPLVFRFGLAPTDGPGLIFQTLPVAFAGMTYGAIVGFLFFLLLVCAALTSCIAIVEPWMRWAEERGHTNRTRNALIAGAILLLAGQATVFSLAAPEITTIAGKTWFDWIDWFTNQIMLPVGGLLLAIFIGWVMAPAALTDELGLPRTSPLFRLWYVLVRYVIPPIIAIVILLGVSE